MTVPCALPPQADNAPADEEAGFKWRSGHDRMTTVRYLVVGCTASCADWVLGCMGVFRRQGIWMWSKHFVVTRPGSNEKIALLVLDTQV